MNHIFKFFKNHINGYRGLVLILLSIFSISRGIAWIPYINRPITPEGVALLESLVSLSWWHGLWIAVGCFGIASAFHKEGKHTFDSPAWYLNIMLILVWDLAYWAAYFTGLIHGEPNDAWNSGITILVILGIIWIALIHVPASWKTKSTTTTGDKE